jgi:hypothetical protein
MKTGQTRVDLWLSAADSYLRLCIFVPSNDIVRQDFDAHLQTIRQEFISEHLHVCQAFDGDSVSFIS